ncbi:harmonin-binding protein USHBP1 [Gastrophryne carolinensis]
MGKASSKKRHLDAALSLFADEDEGLDVYGTHDFPEEGKLFRDLDSSGDRQGYQNDVFVQLQDVISSLEMCVLSWKNPLIERSSSRSGANLLSEPLGTGTMVSTVMQGLAQNCPGTLSSEDHDVLNSEIKCYQEKNAALRVKLRDTNSELDRSRATLKLFTEEKEKLQTKLNQLQGNFQHNERSPPISPPTSPIPEKLGNIVSDSDLPGDLPRCMSPVVALKNVIHHVQSLSGSQPSLACASDIHQNIMESEMKLLKRHLDCIKEVNNQLSQTLEDCKTDSEKLSMHHGKLEATCTALRLALQASEKCLKTYSMLLALAEAKGEILLSQVSSRDLSNLGWNMLQKDLEIKTKLFMMELRKSFRRKGAISESQKSSADQTLFRPYAPWLSEEDEQMLKDYIQSLKWDLSSITLLETSHNDVLYEKEVAHMADIIKVKVDDAIKRSMETSHCLQEKPTRAQLLHELMDTRKGLSELKACLQLLQTEKRALELQCLTQHEQEKAYMLIRDQQHLEQDDWTTIEKNSGKKTLEEQVHHTGHKSITLGHSKAFTPSPVMQQLLESLKQSNEIKEQVRCLTSQLDKLAAKVRSLNSQSSQNIQDFFKAHRNLFLTYKNACRKYQEQQNRMEAQTALISQHQCHQIQKLMEEIHSLQKKKTERDAGETSL